jgi:curved DNA-binding protein CbpA
VPNRKRIALVSEVLEKLSDDEKQAIYDYTNQYGRVMYFDGKFKIETDEDLKFVLWGIEQRFYTTPITGEKRVANSVISI